MVLYQDDSSYCYNSDTHFLHDFVKLVLQEFKNHQGELLDVGSGCGILGLLVARDFPKYNLHQVEIYPKMQFLSQKNAQTNKIASKIFEGSFLEMSLDTKFDMIVSNPPFYNACVVKSQNDHLQKARYNDSMPLGDFLGQCSRLLKDNAKLIFCYDVKQTMDIIHHLRLNRLNLEKIRFVHPKSTKEASLVMIFARKNTKSPLVVLPPLIAFEGGEFSAQVQEIYKNSATHSIKVKL